MTFSVGQRLRDARLDRGLDFDTLVARTKISEKLLKAIEADDRKSFPSGFFYKSFVDQYARALGVDATEIDEEINTLLSTEAPLPLPGQGEMLVRNVAPVVAKRRFGGTRALASAATLAAVLVACSGFYAWWRKMQTRAAAPVASKARSITSSAPPVVVEPPPAQPTPAQPPPPSAQPAAVPVSLNATHPADAPTADATERASGLRLELMAREETWLSVSSDGLMIFKGTLGPHESKRIEGKEFAKLRVNNPAALDVKLNGRPIGPLGPPGQYLIVVFTRDKFHILDSAKDSD